MKNRLNLFGTLLIAASLGACSQGPDPAKVQADITKAQADGQKMVVDAQAKLDQVNAANNKDVVVAQADARQNTAENSQPAPSEADTQDIRQGARNGEEESCRRAIRCGQGSGRSRL